MALFKAFQDTKASGFDREFRRRSERLARTARVQRFRKFSVVRVRIMASSKSSWRPLSACVADVLRETRKASANEVAAVKAKKPG